MTRLIMLDTNMVSYILKGKSPPARLESLPLGVITNDKTFQNVTDLVGVENWATDL